MTTRNNRQQGNNHGQRRNNGRGQPRRDEDDHPIEGYRDGSVYEEQGEAASPGQASEQNLPKTRRANGGKGVGDKTRGAKSAEKRK